VPMIRLKVRWLRNIVVVGLVVAATGVALATGFSDHSDDYGQTPLPQGGVVHLPEGKVTVFYAQLGDSNDPIRQVTTPFVFQVSPVGGGAPVPVSSQGNAQSAEAVQRSETVGELGAVAKLDVPTSGDYMVRGSTNLPAGASFLKFGTNSGAALASKWKLFAALIGGAILLSLIPMPRTKRRWEDEGGAPTGWSSDPRAPYAG
jgi:hypothetical protein